MVGNGKTHGEKETVNACGYDPFNENLFSDHRLMFMDIDKKLFNSENIVPQLVDDKENIDKVALW